MSDKVSNHRLDLVGYQGILRLYCIRCDTVELPSDEYLLDGACVPNVAFQKQRRKSLRKDFNKKYRKEKKIKKIINELGFDNADSEYFLELLNMK